MVRNREFSYNEAIQNKERKANIMNFSEKIIQARKAKALTQEDLAEAVGVSRQAVSKWETGEAKPDLDKLVALCSVLDLSMDQLFLDKEPVVTVEPAAELRKTNSIRYLIIGVCIGIVAVLLICALVYANRNPSAGQNAGAHTDSNYTEMLTMEIRSATIEEPYDSTELQLCFTTSVQVPDMQVQILIKNYRDDTTRYLPAELRNGEYVCSIPRDDVVWIDVTAVCTLDEVIVQMPIAKVQSAGYKKYEITYWWQP